MKSEPIILAFDTATVACSVAAWRAGRVLARRGARMPRGQAEALLPMIGETLAEAGLRHADLDLYAVTIGPGAFTGLRIGLATARALALAAGRPVVPVTTTEALAAAVPVGQRRRRAIVAAIDSKRGDLFAQAFAENGAALGAPRAAGPDDPFDWLPNDDLLVTGDAAERLATWLRARGRGAARADGDPAPDPAVIADLAARRPPVARPSPLYLRPPEATRPANGGRLR